MPQITHCSWARATSYTRNRHLPGLLRGLNAKTFCRHAQLQRCSFVCYSTHGEAHRLHWPTLHRVGPRNLQCGVPDLRWMPRTSFFLPSNSVSSVYIPTQSFFSHSMPLHSQSEGLVATCRRRSLITTCSTTPMPSGGETQACDEVSRYEPVRDVKADMF